MKKWLLQAVNIWTGFKEKSIILLHYNFQGVQFVSQTSSIKSAKKNYHDPGKSQNGFSHYYNKIP